MKPLTVAEVVAVLRRAQGWVFAGSGADREIAAILDRWDDEVEAEQRAEHERALDDAHQPLDGVPW